MKRQVLRTSFFAQRVPTSTEALQQIPFCIKPSRKHFRFIVKFSF